MPAKPATKHFEAVADELYGASPGEFISIRERHAARARREGEKDLAERIHRLRKPTTAAALVNRLSRRHADEVTSLVRLGDRLRRAHRDLAGDRLRELTHERHERVRALADRARALAMSTLGESVRREIEATLEAAVSDEESARALIEGRLATALSPRDVFGSALSTGEPGAKSARSAPRRDERQEQERARRDAEARARQARDDARRELRTAEREEAKARRRTETARAALDAADQEVRRHTR
ncbi:hypothetical protein [Saccharomonospora sp.]|uniref:hypothetical protein n=1 Tax=Saccharomonospora sp. TaxID=33913 RepID=UPI00262A0C18|nr:hypothetical protein [Saccharomonospora sp.]